MVDPRIGRVRQHFALEVGIDVFAERHIFGIAEAGIRERLPLQLAFSPGTIFPFASRSGRSTVIVE